MSTETTNSPFDAAVVGVDGRDGGRDAVALATALGVHRLTLTGVHRPPFGGEPTAAARQYHHLLHDDMVRSLEATRLQAGIVAEVEARGDGSPARALQQAARDHGASLIVLGSAHHGPLGRIVVGDVGRGVLHDAPCAVAIAPRGYHHRPARAGIVAVGYDGSPESVEALHVARDVATATGATLEVHTVWEGPVQVIAALAYSDEIQEMLAEDEERGRRVLDEALAELPAGTTGTLHHGSPKAVLDEVARHADLLVLGSRGWGTVRGVVLGSVSGHVLHSAACPVLVVPRGATVPRGTTPAAPASTTVTAS